MALAAEIRGLFGAASGNLSECQRAERIVANKIFIVSEGVCLHRQVSPDWEQQDLLLNRVRQMAGAESVVVKENPAIT